MLFALAQAAATDADSLAAALEALMEAFGSGDLVLAIVAAVLIAGLVVLKFLGKKLPFVDVVVELALGVARKLSTKKLPPAPGVAVVVEPAKDGEAPKSDGLGNVVNIKKDQ